MNKLALAAVLAALASPALAAGGSVTSQDLFGACSLPSPMQPPDLGKKTTLDNAIAWAKYNRDRLDVMSCRYYILGIADGIGTYADLHNVKDCVPNGVKMGDLADVYVKYYREHPEHRHYDAKELVTAAFVDAYGCRFEGKETKKDTRS